MSSYKDALDYASYFMVQAYEVQPFFPFSVIHYKITKESLKRLQNDFVGTEVDGKRYEVYTDDVLSSYKQAEFLADYFSQKSQNSPYDIKNIRKAEKHIQKMKILKNFYPESFI